MRQTVNTKMNIPKTEHPLYIVINNSILIYQVERYDEQKNIAGLILFKNLTDFKENNPLKKIDVAEWQ
jgi:hypothetical protein